MLLEAEATNARTSPLVREVTGARGGDKAARVSGIAATIAAIAIGRKRERSLCERRSLGV